MFRIQIITEFQIVCAGNMIYIYSNITSTTVFNSGIGRNNFAIAWVPCNSLFSQQCGRNFSITVKMLNFYPGKINKIAHCESTQQNLFVGNKPIDSLIARI